uniref:Insulin-like domain-containing protein n=1 Tax=Anser brachyrhynchus TaxID=132585 RepID=A0A8B9I8K6_9AVES
AARSVITLALAVLAAAPGAAEEPALRLCGREFIRTLVALCGGTRWTRGPPPQHGDTRHGGRPTGALTPPRSLPADLSGRLDGHGPPSVAPPGPAGSCCSHGCTRQELLPFC